MIIKFASRLSALWFVVALALMLQACSLSSKTTISYERAYQVYHDQDCSFDYESAFKDFTADDGVFVSRKVAERRALKFIKSIEVAEQGAESGCFYEALVTTEVPYYGNEAVTHYNYYEIWIDPRHGGRQGMVCAGINQVYPSDMSVLQFDGEEEAAWEKLTPDDYGVGFAQKYRYLPVCMFKGDEYGYLRNKGS